MNVTLYFGGRGFTISGWTSIREIYINGIEVPMVHARIGEPNLDFQPLLVGETGETARVEAQNDGQESEPNDDQVQEDEAPKGEVPSGRAPDNVSTSVTEELLRTEPEV